MINNAPYASLDLLIRKGIGSNADEVCSNLIGKVDNLDLGEAPHDEPTIWHNIRIVGACVEHNPSSMYPDYVHVDAVEV